MYSLSYYSDDTLKSDEIYTWITRIEWKFYEEIRKYLPIILHSKWFVPPRIEVYYTQLKSVKDYAYHHMDDFAVEYFKFMFLNLMTKKTADTIVAFKRKLDPIKLKKNGLKKLLKLRYDFERQIDPFIRYSRDDIWEMSIERLGYEVYQDGDKAVKNASMPWVTTYYKVAQSACAGADHINDQIAILRKEFDDKQQILQHLFDYNNSSRAMRMNTIMIVIAAATLFFVVFPESASWMANIIRNFLNNGQTENQTVI